MIQWTLINNNQEQMLTFTAYPVASMASSPIKKSRSSTPLQRRLIVWSPTEADSLMATAEGMMICGSLLPAKPSLVYLPREKVQHDDQGYHRNHAYDRAT